MEKEKRNKKRTFSLKKKLEFNIDPSFTRNKMKNKSATCENTDNKNLAYLKFKQNILIWLLKNSKYDNQRETSRSRKGKNISFKNSHNKSQLSEKYKNIPGINRLHNLTDKSMNELLNKDSHSNSSVPITLLSAKSLEKRKNKFNSAFKTNRIKSLNEINNENNYKVKKIKNVSLSVALESNNKKNKLSNNKIINNKLFHNIPRYFINNKTINNYINDVNIYSTNKKININIKNPILTLMKNKKFNKYFKVY